MALLLALIVFALSGCSDTTDQKTDGVPAEATEAAMDAASESIKACRVRDMNSNKLWFSAGTTSARH